MFLKKRILAALLVTALACVSLDSCSDQSSATTDKLNLNTTVNDADWSTVTDGLVTIQNQNILFQLDTKTTHFYVKDLKTGKLYNSVPSEQVAAYSDEDQNRMSSEVTISYYQTQSTALYMYSGTDSVANGNYVVKQNKNAVKVYYTMGAKENQRFTPSFFERSTFDKDILGKLSDPNEQRRIQRYYTLYSKSNPDEDYKKMLQKYPVLKNQDLYILNDTISDMEMDEISGYMSEVFYTQKMFAAVKTRLGIKISENNQPVGFVVPVEYTLNEDGFSAKILTNEISENSTSYKLQQIDFLEYFSSCDIHTTGQFMVPDGSGALIQMNSLQQEIYSQPFYGQDYSVQKESVTQNSKDLLLPVFGILEKGNAVFGIVENAAEVATLNAKTMGYSNPLNHIYVSFTVRNMDTTDIAADRQIPIYNLFGKHILKTEPKIRYVFLSGDQADYSGMATYYRNYLLKNGMLKNNLTSASSPPLYIDYLCLITDKSSFLGIPYNKKIVLSDIKSIQSTIQQLNKAGISNLVVRLNGYGKGGLTNYVNNVFQMDSCVGSTKDVTTLADFLAKQGGKLYIDADFQFVYKDNIFDGFSPNSDTAHYLNRSLVRVGDYDRVTRQYNNNILSRFFVSPTQYLQYASGYLESTQVKFGADNSIGLSYASAGTFLGGDYTAKKDIDRTMSMSYLNKALQAVCAQKGSVLTDNGNAYMLAYSQNILNVPLFCSNFDSEAETIPFYQMVIHGLTNYCGTSFNLSTDPEINFLRSLEYGANLSYTWITNDDALLKNTDYEDKLYSLNSASMKESVIQQYIKVQPFLSSIQKAKMIKHENLSENVFRTTYDNGVSIVINYGNKIISLDGETIKGRDYHVYKK